MAKREKAAAAQPATEPASNTTGRKAPIELGRALVEAFLTNERINQILIDLLPPSIWRAFPPCSKRRNIATSFAHIHNVRCMRLAMSARDMKAPARLDRSEVTPDQAKKALAVSASAFAHLVQRSVEAGGLVPEFRPDVVSLVCAALVHEAHHRGQVCHWARELGAPIPPEAQLSLWEWDKRWKEVVAGRSPD